MSHQPISLEEYQALPDDDDFIDEVSYGRLIREPRPGFDHGRVVMRFGYLVQTYLEQKPIGRIVTETGFILKRNPLVLRGPDIAFVTAARIPGDPGFFDGAPDLAIEVVSPSNRAGELLQKIGEMLDAGTRVAWLVYPSTRTVVEYTGSREPHIYGPDDTLTAPDVLPGFVLPVTRIFE